MSVAAGSGVTFTAADALTDPAAAPDLFGAYQSSPLPFATDPADPDLTATFPNIDFVAGDVSMTAPGSVTLNPGDILGLIHVTFSAAAGLVPGAVVPVALGETSLSDGNGDPVAFSAVGGTITMTTVPERSSLAVCGLGSDAGPSTEERTVEVGPLTPPARGDGPPDRPRGRGRHQAGPASNEPPPSVHHRMRMTGVVSLIPCEFRRCRRMLSTTVRPFLSPTDSSGSSVGRLLPPQLVACFGPRCRRSLVTCPRVTSLDG